ncbi:MAG: polyprenyl synthetase family protein [Cyanobacteria bacterium SIG32]|nr:polyprenyl synthetase family protein [Cyanobacteria bacterium SIG32]
MNNLINLVNENLERFMDTAYPNELFESMRYTVLLPGKRLRPVMCLETCRMLGGNIEDAIPTACAIEMYHAMTLIHDDLPCMDNDDFRRGKPTNHKVFGEATAVLAGDALLTYAPQIITKHSKNLGSDKLLKLLEEYFQYAGAYGVIAGQVVDIESEKKYPKNAAETLNFIHTHKTADLFKLAIRSGAIIANATDKQIADLTDFAEKLGFAFQISDDILDEISTFEEMGKTLGKDKTAEKLTYTNLYGIENAKCKLTCLLDECYDRIQESVVFKEIIDAIKKRVGI